MLEHICIESEMFASFPFQVLVLREEPVVFLLINLLTILVVDSPAKCVSKDALAGNAAVESAS